MACYRTWKKCRYFNKDSKIDKWGDTKLINGTHLLRLDDFRHYLGIPIYVTSGVKTKGHAKNSYHYPRKNKAGKLIGACATDIVIPDYEFTPFDLVLDAQRFGFTGIGYYPHWRFNGEIVGGLHLDSRPLKWDKDQTINYKHSRWMAVLNHKGKQEYIGLTFQNMLEYSKYSETIDIGKLH